MNPEQSQKDDGEINLTELIRFIWNGKWLIIGVTAVTCIIAVIYLISMPKTYTGKLKVSPISAIETLQYIDLNSSKLIDINSEELELLFIQNVREYKSLEASITENMYLKKFENETELDFSRRIKVAARRLVEVTKPEATSTLSFTTRQPKLARKVVTEALLLSNGNVRMELQTMIDIRVAAYSRHLTKEIEDIDLSSKILLKNEKLKVQARLAFLNEQSAIAKALGIKEDTPPTQTIFAGDATINGNIDIRGSYTKNERSHYLLGYFNIDKEIELLLSRRSPQLFIPKFLANERDKEEIIKDSTITRTKKSLALSPIGSNTFKSVSYNIDSLEFKSTTNSLKILLLSIILGGVMGLIVLVIRVAVIRKK